MLNLAFLLLVSVLAELGGDDPRLPWSVRGFLLPPASAKLKLNALSLIGSREGFCRAARSGSTVLVMGVRQLSYM